MTRTFGDRVSATFGVISEPEIKEWNFMEGDKFMLIASDGVWDLFLVKNVLILLEVFMRMMI